MFSCVFRPFILTTKYPKIYGNDEKLSSIIFWNWAPGHSNQQQKRWRCFANNRAWIVEKSAVKTDIQLEKDHKLVCVWKYLIRMKCPPFLTFVYPLQNKLIIKYKAQQRKIKLVHFCYRRTIQLKQENFSCYSKTNYTRRHEFITQKNNCCQVFSRSRNDQPLFVNEYKVNVGWQSSSLKNKFSGFRRANINIFQANPNRTPRLLTNMWVFSLQADFKTLFPLFLFSFHW